MSAQQVDAVVIGAGFGGLYAVHALSSAGFSVQAFEAGNGVGGTWYWNRYPGARCDVESISYSYTFDDSLVQEWTWSERFAAQPEIQAYAAFVADRLDLNRHITFRTTIASAVWDDQSSTWLVTTSQGQETRCRFLICATGNLSATQTPRFPGLEDFGGTVLHTGRWPHTEVDVTGQRVVVIGTGSSGTQAIPLLAKQASQLTVMMRTPNYSMPARNRALTGEELRRRRRFSGDVRQRALAHPAGHDIPVHAQTLLDTPPESRAALLEFFWQLGGHQFLFAFNDTMVNMEANAIVADFVRGKIRETVEDPETAELLCPDYPFGAKRTCLDSDFYETFNQPHVSLIGLRDDPLERFTATGVATSTQHVEADVVVLATGFDAMTGPLTRIDIRGRDGQSLKEVWSENGPAAYLGLSVAGFPNLFLLTGPGSPSVLANVIAGIEQHVDWVLAALEHLRDNGLHTIEATPESQAAWWELVQDIASGSIYSHAKSWYRGDNIDGKRTGFMVYAGGLLAYRETCDAVASEGYRGFTLSSRSRAVAAG